MTTPTTPQPPADPGTPQPDNVASTRADPVTDGSRSIRERFRAYLALADSSWEDALVLGVAGTGPEANQARLERAQALKREYNELSDYSFSVDQSMYDPSPREVFGLEHVIAAGGDLDRVFASPEFASYHTAQMRAHHKADLEYWETSEADWERPRPYTQDETTSALSGLREAVQELTGTHGRLPHTTTAPPAAGDEVATESMNPNQPQAQPDGDRRTLTARAAQLRLLATQAPASAPGPQHVAEPLLTPGVGPVL